MTVPAALDATTGEGRPRVALYCRLSRDHDQSEQSLDSQIHDMREYADERGWRVVSEIRETGSAFDNVGGRPGFGELVALVRAGEVDVVAAVAPDRFSRDDSESSLFRADLAARGVLLSTRMGGDVDLSSPGDRMLAGIMANVAQYESAIKRDRNLRTAARRARAGLVSGGGWRPYGYENDRITIRESEAVVVRELAARLIAGEGVKRLAADLNERGIATTTDGRWKPSPIRRMMRSARISGRREHRGEIVADAVWPGIISPAESDTIRAMIGQRRTGTPRRYLLTGGITVCSKCGHQLIAQAAQGRPRVDADGDPIFQTDDNGDPVFARDLRGRLKLDEDGHPKRVPSYEPRPAYRCPHRTHVASNGESCNGTTIDGRAFESFIGAAVVKAVDAGVVSTAGSVDGERWVLELAELHRRVGTLTSIFTAGHLDAVEYAAAMADIGALRRKAEAALDAATRGDPMSDVDGLLAAAWDAMRFEDRRLIVERTIARIVIGPAVRGRNTFDQTRVAITWR